MLSIFAAIASHWLCSASLAALQLYPGGPTVTRCERAVEVDLGVDRSNGFLRATYDSQSRIERIETFNGAGKRIQWTQYNANGRHSIVTSYDLGETGRATRWETSTAEPVSGRTLYLVEELEAGSGRRIERARWSVASLQPERCGVAEPVLTKNVEEVVQGISSAWSKNATNCPAPGALKFDDGEHEFTGSGPFCIDKTCNANEGLELMLRDTLKQGVGCLAKLGTDRLPSRKAGGELAALKKTLAGGPVESNSKLLKRSFALRNAAQLLMIANQSGKIGDLWDSNQQSWITPDDATKLGARYLTSQEVKSAQGVPTTGPLKLYCSKERAEGGSVQMPFITAAGQIRSADMRKVRMLTSMPGNAGWPAIGIQKDTGRSYKGEPASYDDRMNKALLFHEMMHLIGFPHVDNPKGVDEYGVGRTVPAAVACQACCFPEGFTRNENWTPDDSKCGVKSPAHATVCGVCAGDAGTTRDELKGWDHRAYENAATGCYRNFTPL
ncbi:MAG: hypothetical protein HY074_09810 [Deltaproteobacteria bacterium]|nr:hypothetical protein [Deltaproteobacteria bacterium]